MKYIIIIRFCEFMMRGKLKEKRKTGEQSAFYDVKYRGL